MKTFYGNYGLALFNSQEIPCKNAHEDFIVLIYTNFDSFANIYLI